MTGLSNIDCVYIRR